MSLCCVSTGVMVWQSHVLVVQLQGTSECVDGFVLFVNRCDGVVITFPSCVTTQNHMCTQVFAVC